MADSIPDVQSLARLLREAAAIAQDARRTLERQLKPDGSIVTNADRQVEEFLRPRLMELAPGSEVWGEEEGGGPEGPGGLWVVDPIDGTSNFTFGSPLWGISVALVQGDQITVGGVALPDLDSWVLAKRDEGAVWNGRVLDPIPAGPVQPYELVSHAESVNERLGGTIPGKMRSTGAFVIDGCWVAAQRYRGLVGQGERLHDIAACVLICQELGADVRFVDGSAIDLDRHKAGEKLPKPWLIFPRETNYFGPNPRG